MGETRLGRREFLRLGIALGSGAAAASLAPGVARARPAQSGTTNIIVLVLDSLSAANMSVFGYARRTTPAFEDLARRSLVFGRHYANGNFTSPGAASILTGMLPWTHRAVSATSVPIRGLGGKNVFSLLGGLYHTAGASQNSWADFLLDAFEPGLAAHIARSRLGMLAPSVSAQGLPRDHRLAELAYEALIQPGKRDPANALLLSPIMQRMQAEARSHGIPTAYPRGLPTNDAQDEFDVRSSFDGAFSLIRELQAKHTPYIVYIHLWPPHEPYRPHADFVDLFRGDGKTWPDKGNHPLSNDNSPEAILTARREYDEFVANVDAEFGRWLAALEAEGVLTGAYLFVTSDHGEMFEHGVSGHWTRLMFEPVIRIPLLVATPGDRTQRQVLAPTSSVDLLPTFLALAGLRIPDWCEGSILPGLGGALETERSVFSVEAKECHARRPLRTATLVLVRGRYKLVHYRGYKGRYSNHYEFYDLEEDPEELRDLWNRPRLADVQQALRAELRAALAAADEPYV